ncbi:TPA: DUF551 domain-containing protein [Escherichia coli]|nr:DUF551 domain-containing protein [Escherichia coli]MCB6864310.1 DUF551 domain-containing protein [Escherichia coli]HAJ3973145.1 DUF551 domain-containing protein [Escherichia coli]HAJ4002289.1 DUF551 domain-containing protein [Escherichia coli]HAJ4470225.1 DUF551 domain-containing protein [Escherichia coli]HAJ4585182.1 DUF551 domain-containing protein [Escherichia coli]
MTTFTKEQLISHARESVSYLENLKGRVSKEGADCKVVLEMVERDLELARIALASLEAELIGFRCRRNDNLGDWSYVYHREPDDFERKHLVIEGIYAAPPEPVVPEEATPENVEMLSGYVSTYKLTDSERDIAAEIWNACRTAMLQSGNFRESKNSSTNNFREIPEASTSSPVTPALLPGGFTIEEAKELHEDLVRSHISKALSGEKMKKKDRDADLRWIHGVIVQAAWFVKASLEQNALSGNSPVTPDGWISCSERMPDDRQEVVVQTHSGWRYIAFYESHSGLFYDSPEGDVEYVFVTHWMPLPEPPQEVNRG